MMDFSSANVPIARDTWAPRSPPRGPAAPYGGEEYDRPPSSSTRQDVDMRDGSREAGGGYDRGSRE
ncbi:hypothetical protein M231_02605 [Tremella mesenterica]|uniref:Uncharacterized protein n=1 Tax=Tremella mesenterica TaxID=5217 RepID=A0A4V1M4F1_TREME|nr:hypothetical protein M231_02605 [Tremella mesenterica]